MAIPPPMSSPWPFIAPPVDSGLVVGSRSTTASRRLPRKRDHNANQINTAAEAETTGTSSWKLALTRRRPMPGTKNIISNRIIALSNMPPWRKIRPNARARITIVEESSRLRISSAAQRPPSNLRWTRKFGQVAK